MKRTLVLGAILAGFLVFAHQAAAATKLVVAGSEATGSLLDRMAIKFEELLEANSGGAFKINLIRGQSLGNAQQVMEQHQAGSVDVMYSRPDWFTSTVTDFQVLTWGFTFRDRAHMQTFLDSDLFAGLTQQAVDKMGVRILGATVDQPRILYSRKPVDSVDDIQGIKMRVPGIKAYLKLWKTLGTVPTQVAWAEAFLALKTGAVDAAEADASGAFSQRFHVAAPNITLTNHLMSSASISINEAKWKSLTESEQKAIGSAAREALAWMSSEAEKDAKKLLDKMASEGATIKSIDNGPFSEKARAGVAEMEAEGLWSKGLWQRIRDL